MSKLDVGRGVTQSNEYDTLPKAVKWTLNWYFIVAMLVLCGYNLGVELSRQPPDAPSLGWCITHTVCVVWWVYQICKRWGMDRKARRIVL